MQLILLVTLAKDQTHKYFHFFIRQPYTSQTRTVSALTLLSAVLSLQYRAQVLPHKHCLHEPKRYHNKVTEGNKRAVLFSS